jgi:Integrase core domain
MPFISERRARIELKSAYYSPASDVAFSSESALLKKFKNKISSEFIKNWISEQPTHALHRKRDKRFPRLKAFAYETGFYHSDLSPQSSALAKANKNCHQLLVICDTLTRRLDAVLIPNKDASSMINGMKILLKRNNVRIIYSDRGKEYVSKQFENFLKTQNIQHFLARNIHKAFLAEMSIRRLRTRINKYLEFKKTKSFYSQLPAIVDGLNRQYNRNLKFAPADITSKKLKRQVFENLYFDYLKKPRKLPTLKVGDKVRIAIPNTDFEKNYARINYSTEIFKISQVLPKKIPVFKIIDLDGKSIEGTWYAQELYKVNG